MYIERMGMLCCAGIEIDGLAECYERGGIDLVLAHIMEEVATPGFLIFTNATTFTSGRALTRAVRRLKLGSVTEVDAGPNPATLNPIRIWVWVVNQKAFAAYERVNTRKHRNLIRKFDP